VPYSPSASEIRLLFAKRLKQLRTEKGFVHARTFAKVLGIEENRYTRYERAEVEPSLTLIHRICQTLQVSPNDLLAFTADVPGETLEPSPPTANLELE
jgi:transcriptional regulator with XRE-family HTH domain